VNLCLRLANRTDLHKQYGGQRQGGISMPKKYPFLLLFTGQSGGQFGYQDSWQNGVFLYTGEGQSGDMQFRVGNKVIRDHSKDGKALHLFKQEKKGYVRYKGEFALSSFQYSEGTDKNQQSRRTIVFQLKPVSPEKEDSEGDVLEFKQGGLEFSVDDMEAMRRKSYAAASEIPETNTRDGKRRYYERSANVRAYVLARSKGVCEACNKPAPFLRRDGTPYLEPHHTHLISESGPDHPRWVGAICPNCHREIHHGREGETLNAQLQMGLLTFEKEG
jgi:5-methylcytosine-specific restriction protein A